LHRNYGLLTRRASSLPRRRIQVLTIEEGLLRRLFGLAALRVETVGARDEDDSERREGRDLLLPVTARNRLDDLLPVVFPDLDAGEWRRVSPLAIRRGMKKVIVIVLMATIALSLGFGTRLWLWLPLLIPICYLIIRRRYENLGYALGERYLWTRHGWLGRLTQIVPIRKAQVLEIRETPFDRRLGLATLVIDTAGQSQTKGGPHVGNLPREDAYRLARLLARQAAATEYRP
jgi:putative membrane protein